MPDIAKRINKTGQLLAGEQAIAGCFCAPVGNFGATAAFGAVGAVVSESRAVKRAAETTNGEQTTLAASIPAAQGLIAVTGHRVVVFGAGKLAGGAKDVQASFEFSEIREFTADHGVASSRMHLVFVDGSFRSFESVRGGKPKDFAAALDQALAAIA